MTVYVKKGLLKNLSIIKAKYILLDKIVLFEDKWRSFITDLNADVQTRNSWYITV